jgi:hypothetical protein
MNKNEDLYECYRVGKYRWADTKIPPPILSMKIMNILVNALDVGANIQMIKNVQIVKEYGFNDKL